MVQLSRTFGITWSLLWTLLVGVTASPSAMRVYNYIMNTKEYNRLVRPAGDNAILLVRLGLRISQLIRVDAKNQVMTTSVWLKHEWFDKRLSWDPKEFGNVKQIKIPSDSLWRPDIVLYNNADGDFVITMTATKATVYSNGKISWEPPAIYKTYCPIDVEYFPFDIQKCMMRFGSWTYDGLEVDLVHFCHEQGTNKSNGDVVNYMGIDLKGYQQNVEWDILDVYAVRKIESYPCCPESYIDIRFNLLLRRKPLFYTLNLIAPCVSISLLTVLVFYLPSVSGEKITLSISVLLALSVFFLLLADIIPPTSLVIPLIGQYLMFTMFMVTASLFLTVYVLNINYRKPTTHSMSNWVRYYLLEKLPPYLWMKRPDINDRPLVEIGKVAVRTMNGMEVRELTLDSNTSTLLRSDVHTYENMRNRHPTEELEPSSCQVEKPVHYGSSKDVKIVKDIIDNIKYIANHMKESNEDEQVVRDWAYVAMVVDRVLLYLFSLAVTVGTIGCFLSAPAHYDTKVALQPIDFENTSCTY
ncbi:acetylcholine receptor subunit alpha-like 1 [Octopus vulgaris]|uniref:Acetylcholine receptor subunit alpha-like 1 n=1 Tax=Octopus vulgaris TaxID=6645 RepID=A0A9Y1GAE0_OCTVU|nr:acetylcholine receptor subunit alpha-like 1 [Octopus vulgaris]CAI9731365.1 acetylcholine receptor subunit alpha-like 1 [Octopus vulgaris]